MAQVKVAAIDAVIGGTEITVGDTWVQLQDSTSGFNGPGSYHIQLSSSGAYVVTYGLRPSDASNLMTIGRVVLTPSGDIVLADKRVLNVGWVGVNATIMQTPNADGSYLADGVVTERTIRGGISGLLDSLGSVEGDILYRGASDWLVLAPGTAGYVLSTGGPGAAPSWVSAGGGGTPTVPSGSSFPGSPISGQLFFRTDLLAMFWYNGTAWKNVDSLAQLNDVTLTSPAANNLLAYNGSAWVNATLSALLDAIGSTRGAILERGASGWAIIAPSATAGYVFTSNGAGADPSWQAPSSGSGSTGSCTETQYTPNNATATKLFASSGGRLGGSVRNKSTSTLYVGTTGSVTTALFTDYIDPGDYWELPRGIAGTVYTGDVWGILDKPDSAAVANVAAYPS